MKTRKKMIGRDNIIKIGNEVDKIRSLLCSIIRYAEGYKDPLDTLIYSRRELDTLKDLEKSNKKIIELKETNEYLSRIIHRDIDKHEKRIKKLESANK